MSGNMKRMYLIEITNTVYNLYSLETIEEIQKRDWRWVAPFQCSLPDGHWVLSLRRLARNEYQGVRLTSRVLEPISSAGNENDFIFNSSFRFMSSQDATIYPPSRWFTLWFTFVKAKAVEYSGRDWEVHFLSEAFRWELKTFWVKLLLCRSK